MLVYQVVASSGWDLQSSSSVVATCAEQQDAEAIASELGDLASVRPLETATFASWYEARNGRPPGRHRA